ncbi:MAG: hypothetical protein COB29_00830 [Sulfitobacter sp.]|nr:MAG: hypothetical protein COB29_00830 [Sulfitobacter sp.]
MSTNMTDITIVIQADCNHSLKEQLSHLLEESCQYEVLIVDRSDGPEHKNIANIVNKFDKSLVINWISMPLDTTILQRLVTAVESVNTDYVILTGDGDFVFIDGLRYAARHLDDHKEIVAVQGVSVTLRREENGIRVSPCLFPTQNTNHRLNRLERFMISYEHTLSALHRKETLLNSLRACTTEDVLWPQLIRLAISACTILQGHTAYIPKMFSVRPSKSNIDFGSEENWNSLITHPDFSNMVNYWTDLLIGLAIQLEKKLDSVTFSRHARKSLYEYLKIPLAPEFRRVTTGMTEQSQDAYKAFCTLSQNIPGQENLESVLKRHRKLLQMSTR